VQQSTNVSLFHLTEWEYSPSTVTDGHRTVSQRDGVTGKSHLHCLEIFFHRKVLIRDDGGNSYGPSFDNFTRQHCRVTTAMPCGNRTEMGKVPD